MDFVRIEAEPVGDDLLEGVSWPWPWLTAPEKIVDGAGAVESDLGALVARRRGAFDRVGDA